MESTANKDKDAGNAERVIGDELTGKDVAAHIQVRDTCIQPQPSSSSTANSSSARSELAQYFNMTPETKIRVGDTNVWVVYEPIFPSGTFARIFDEKRKIELGVVKTPHSVESTVSLQALCKQHTPARSCHCWVTCHGREKKIKVMNELIHWLATRCEKDVHRDSSIQIRKANGMKVRQKTLQK